MYSAIRLVACGTYMIPSAPEFFAPVLVFPLAELLISIIVVNPSHDISARVRLTFLACSGSTTPP